MQLTVAGNGEVSRGRRVAGWIVTGLLTALLLLDAVMKFAEPRAIVAAGWPVELSVTLGVLVLVSTILWLIPRTAVLGAILLTGYLGGAVATNLRLEKPLFAYTLSPVYVGVLVWLALWLREPQICALIPLRKSR